MECGREQALEFAAAANRLYNRRGEIDKLGGGARVVADDNADSDETLNQGGFQEDANDVAVAEG